MHHRIHTPVTRHCELSVRSALEFLCSEVMRNHTDIVPIIQVEGPTTHTRLALDTFISNYLADYGFRTASIKSDKLISQAMKIRTSADLYSFASYWYSQIYELAFAYLENDADFVIVQGNLSMLIRIMPLAWLPQQDSRSIRRSIQGIEDSVKCLHTFIHPADPRFNSAWTNMQNEQFISTVEKLGAENAFGSCYTSYWKHMVENQEIYGLHPFYTLLDTFFNGYDLMDMACNLHQRELSNLETALQSDILGRFDHVLSTLSKDIFATFIKQGVKMTSLSKLVNDPADEIDYKLTNRLFTELWEPSKYDKVH